MEHQEDRSPSMNPGGGELSENARGLRRRRLRRTLGVLFFAVVLLATGVGGYLWWLRARNFETTDNAYVHATVAPVSSRVEAVVEEVLVEDNKAVNEGDLLIRLDASLFRVAVEKAEAEVAVARARFESSKISVSYSTGRFGPLLDEARARLSRLRQMLRSAEAFLRQRRNETQAAAANLARARDELARKRRLHRERVISDDVLEQAQAGFRVADATHRASKDAQIVEEQRVAALGQQLKEVQASLSLVEKEVLSTQMKSMDSKSVEAELRHAEANLKEARLRLSYTDIRAPFTGYVNKKSVEVGTFVEPGRPLLIIVPLHQVYIQANFKEGQLENVRVGQPAVVVADAYPDRPFRGRVESIYSGTGDAFSLLPAENATGNWVKVTRRVPVKVVLEETPPPNFPLLVGMSAYVKVDVRDQSGARLLAYPSRVQRSAPGGR